MRRGHTSPKFDNVLDETMKRLLRASLSPATRIAYARVLRHLANFLGFACIEEIRKPFQESDIMRYVTFLFHSGLAFPSILSRLSAITFWIRSRNWPLVTQTYSVSQLLRGVKALAVRPNKSKFPLTPDVLKSLCLQVNDSVFSPLVCLRLKAMFLLAFHGFLRVGELCGPRHALQLKDVNIQPTFVMISFRSFKFSGGRCPSIFIPSIQSPWCPVQALRSYVQGRGSAPGCLFLESDGSPCSIAQFRKDLARVVKSAGLASWGITPHSFRVGAATSAAAIGIPEDTIQRMGRWSSRAFLRYIKFQINRL